MARSAYLTLFCEALIERKLNFLRLANRQRKSVARTLNLAYVAGVDPQSAAQTAYNRIRRGR